MVNRCINLKFHWILLIHHQLSCLPGAQISVGISKDRMHTIYDMGQMSKENGGMEQGFTFGTDFGRTDWGGIHGYQEHNNDRNRIHRYACEVDAERNASNKQEHKQVGDHDKVIDTFREFTQSTTFHGIRYIFGGRNLSGRK